MRKISLWWLLLGLLVACGPATTPAEPTAVVPETVAESEATSTETESEPATVATVPTKEVEATEETTVAGEEAPAAADEPAEKAVTGVFPASTMEEASVVRDTDHVLGASEPIITIIEYGDFQ